MHRLRPALGLLLAAPLLAARAFAAATPETAPPIPDAIGRTVASVGWIAEGPADPKIVNALIGITAGRP